jgi:hypothetical protein
MVPRKNTPCCYDYGDPQPVKWVVSIPVLSTSPFKDSQGPEGKPDRGIKVSPTTSKPIESLLEAPMLIAKIPHDVFRTIQASHQSIDEIGSRYFNGLHLWVPFFCPDQFQRDVVHFCSVPTADFSLLLLCMSLITYDPPQDQPPPIGHDTLYLQAKTLFTQSRVSRHPSIHLIQAGIFLSIYEYAHARPDSALESIDICARMAYKARINQKPERPGWSEAWNTWWAIRIFERVFYCETTLADVPLISAAPDEVDLLPSEVGNSRCEDLLKSACQVGPISIAGVGCLGRAAQAAYLLDQVFEAMTMPATFDRISGLIVLDSEIQRLLSATMNRCHGNRGGHCGAVCISIRSDLHLPLKMLTVQANDIMQSSLHTPRAHPSARHVWRIPVAKAFASSPRHRYTNDDRHGSNASHDPRRRH